MITALTLAVDESKVRPGWIALFIVLGLGIATVLLWRSMNHQLSKISVKHASEIDEEQDVEATDEDDESPERPDAKSD